MVARNKLESLVVRIMKITGYRFPRVGLLFARDSRSRNVLIACRINAVRCNFWAGE